MRNPRMSTGGFWKRRESFLIGLVVCSLFILYTVQVPKPSSNALLHHYSGTQEHYLKYSSSSTSFKIAIIADKDTRSHNPSKNHWESIIRYGTLKRDAQSKKYSISWEEEDVIIASKLTEAGRGMELSELVHYNGYLYAPDDRTGIVYKIVMRTSTFRSKLTKTRRENILAFNSNKIQSMTKKRANTSSSNAPESKKAKPEPSPENNTNNQHLTRSHQDSRVSVFDFDLCLDDHTQVEFLRKTRQMTIPGWLSKNHFFPAESEYARTTAASRSSTQQSTQAWELIRSYQQDPDLWKSFVAQRVVLLDDDACLGENLSELKISDVIFDNMFDMICQRPHVPSMSESLVSALSTTRLELLCPFGPLCFDRNVGGKCILPASFLKDAEEEDDEEDEDEDDKEINEKKEIKEKKDIKKETSRKKKPSRADACVGFNSKTLHGFRAGNAWNPFIVEEHKAEGAVESAGTLQLIAYMIVALIGLQREIGRKHAVVYGSLQIGRSLKIYRMVQHGEKSDSPLEKPFFLQPVAAYNMAVKASFRESLKFYMALYQAAIQSLQPMLQQAQKMARDSLEPKKKTPKKTKESPAARDSPEPKKKTSKKTKESPAAREVSSSSEKVGIDDPDLFDLSEWNVAKTDIGDQTVEEYLGLTEIVYDQTDFDGNLIERANLRFHPKLKDQNVIVKFRQGSAERTKKEIEVLYKLGGVNHIPPILDVLVKRRPWTVLAVLPDLSKDQISLRRTRLDAVRIKSVMRQLFEGLHYLHSNFIVHGDVKPDNIIYNKQDELYIIDFDSCWNLGERMTNKKFGGTRGYVFPKLKEGEPALPFLDMFAAGITFANLVLGSDNIEHKQLVEYCKVNAHQPAADMMGRLLSLDKKNHISALEALSHLYFVQDSLVPSKN